MTNLIAILCRFLPLFTATTKAEKKKNLRSFSGLWLVSQQIHQLTQGLTPSTFTFNKNAHDFVIILRLWITVILGLRIWHIWKYQSQPSVFQRHFCQPATPISQVKNRLVMPHPLKLICYEKWTAPIGHVWSRDYYRWLEGDDIKTWTCRSQCFQQTRQVAWPSNI